MRNSALDFAKFSCAFMVVAQHSNFFIDINHLVNYLTINGFFRVAVPIFLLISGFYFFKIKNFLQLREVVQRLLILYFFWNLIYLPFWFNNGHGVLENLKNFMFYIVLGYRHLWYMSGLIAALLILYLIRNANSFLMFFLVFALYVFGVFIQYAGNYNIFQNDLLNSYANLNWVHRNFLFFCFPFLALGFLISKHMCVINIYKRWIVISIAPLLFSLFLESFLNYSSVGRVGGFDNYISLFFVCPALFYVMTVFFQNFRFSQTNDLSVYSSGVYFVHMIFIFFLDDLLHPTTLAFIAFFLSCIFVFVIRKMPRISNYIF